MSEQPGDNAPPFIPYATAAVGNRYDPPDPSARNLALMCHLLALSMLVLPVAGSVLGPLIGWLVVRHNHWFVDDQGKEAINFNLTMFIAYLLCIPLFCVFGLGGLLAVFVYVFNIVMVIVAAVQASGGKLYRYPLTIRFV